MVVEVVDAAHLGGELRSVLAFQVVLACRETLRSCRIRRTVSTLIERTRRDWIR
jgi:hypothetical protein